MKLLIPTLAALLAAPAALAAPTIVATAPSGETTGACTQSEADALALEVAERINDIIDDDPQRAAQINNELQEMKLKRTAETLETECQAYRVRLEEIKRARERSGLPPADDLNLMPGQRPQPQ